uniref:Si:ch211-226m16.3 n=1 Tax=Astyanax mexicanus TaxID=7994 RepID=W5K1F9_ASTMX
EELGSHQLQRLVDLLTVHECEELFLALTNPEEKVFKQLERLSAEKNPKETHCHPALTDWLRIHGEQTYYDRLSLALQQIGRTDIAIVGKNLNQDKTLGLQRYVEEYHEQVNKMRSLSWKDLDLVVERQLVPPYQRQFLDGAWPLLYGLIFGFVAALGVGLPVMLFTMRICLGSQTKT